MTIHDLPKLSKNEMEALFQQSKRRSLYFLIFSFSFIIFCIWQYFTTTNKTLQTYLFVFFCIAFCIWFFISAGNIFVLRFMSVPLEKVKEEKLGDYTLMEVKKLIDQVFAKSLINEKPQLYIVNMDNAFAAAADIYLLNFIKPFNAIYISKGCFRSLTLDEIEAVILHEMAHFNKYMYHEAKTFAIGVNMFLFLPFAFTVIIPGTFLKIVFVVGVIICSSKIFSVIRRTKEYESHVNEYLCDFYAAEKTSLLVTINMLIAMAKDNIETEEENKKKILEKILKPVNRTLVDWKKFDTLNVNGRIESEEYDGFIHTLVSSENPQLIKDTLVDHNSNSHPSLTNRILFLNNNFSK